MFSKGESTIVVLSNVKKLVVTPPEIAQDTELQSVFILQQAILVSLH